MTTIVSINPPTGPYYPGQQVSLELSDASASGKAVNCSAGSCQVVEQDELLIAFIMPHPLTFGNRSLNFIAPQTFTVVDGAESDTVDIAIEPEDETFFSQVASLDGINGDPAANVAVGDWRYGFWHTGGGMVDYASGTVAPTDRGELRSYRRDGVTGIWDADYFADNVNPPLDDNQIVLRDFADPPAQADVSPFVDTSEAGWGGIR